jgi:hypothetical protein
LRSILPALSLVLFGCHLGSPNTLADPKNAPAYGYTPLDPLDAYPKDVGNCPVSKARVLASLPDVTMRLASASVSDTAHLRYGTGTLGTSGNSYTIVLDYTMSQTQRIGLYREDDSVQVVSDTDTTKIRRFGLSAVDSAHTAQSRLIYVPVYLGIGLRLTATVTVFSGKIDLGNLIAIGAAVQHNQASGTMVVQTMGINGASVSEVLPMPSDINTSTVQSLLQTLGEIKSKVFDDSTTKPFIQVLGFYNPLGGGQTTTNRIISAALLHPPTFYLVPCHTDPPAAH